MGEKSVWVVLFLPVDYMKGGVCHGKECDKRYDGGESDSPDFTVLRSVVFWNVIPAVL